MLHESKDRVNPIDYFVEKDEKELGLRVSARMRRDGDNFREAHHEHLVEKGSHDFDFSSLGFELSRLEFVCKCTLKSHHRCFC